MTLQGGSKNSRLEIQSWSATKPQQISYSHASSPRVNFDLEGATLGP